MSRIRLTKRTFIANDPADMEGNRQDCGKKTRFEKYNNFDPAKDDVGGRGKKQTDGSKLYSGDQSLRNEMNVTELKLRQAKMWQRSKLATKLAMYLLGQKAPQSMIKAQAAEFLSLGNAKLAKAVGRFAKTQYLYAEQEEAPAAEQPKAQEAEQEEAPAAEQPKAEQPKAQEAEQEEAPAAEQPKAEQPKAEQPKAEQPKAQEAEQEEAPAAEQPKAQEAEQEEAPAAEQPKAQEAEQEEECEESCAISEEQEITETEAEQDEIDQATLASLFESNGNAIVAKKEAKTVAKKVGVQKFEQPQKAGRVASNKISLSDLWKGAPDLSDIF